MSQSETNQREKIEFEQLLQQPQECLKLTQAVCSHHSLPLDCTRITGGSRLLHSVADRHIIKIFPPNERDFFETEALFLKDLSGKLPVSTPRLDAAASWGKYPYLIMEKLPGEPLRTVWASFSPVQKRRIISELGNAIRALHQLPHDPFRSAPFAWDPFIDHQKAALIDNHRAFGLDERWVSQLTDYCDSISIDLHDPTQIAPLHTELMQEHIFVVRKGDEWHLSGLIDFEPSMIGHREYEFCAVGLFLTQGNRDLFRLFLSSYGYVEKELTADLSRRLMKLLLLHRYSNLKWFMTMIPPELRITTLRQLEQFWFGM
jgi:hygromycin-B 7''-O-kinase